MKIDNSLDFENEQEKQDFLKATYTGKAFLYIEDGEVVANPERKPVRTWTEDETRHFITWDEYEYLLKVWEECCIEVENMDIGKRYWSDKAYIMLFNDRRTKSTEPIKYATDGQPCYIENGIVTELLTH